MANKMITCSACGNTIAASAKNCPHCGAKVKKPLIKKAWFWILVVILAAGIGGALGSSKDSGSGSTSQSASKETASGQSTSDQAAADQAAEPESQEESVSYTPVTVEELTEALEKNAAAASDQYKGQYVELTGRLTNIDSDGDYIALGVMDENDYEHMFTSVQCYIKNDEQMDIVKTLETGNAVAVRGKIKSVGEVMGYSIDIDELSAQ